MLPPQTLDGSARAADDEKVSRSRWDWIEQNVRGGLDASALGKLFKNRADSMSTAALLVREGIQNSFDASRPYRTSGVPFRMRFRFAEYSGARKKEIASAFGLDELKSRLDSTNWPESTPPVDGTSLRKTTDPLTVLYLEDFGAHGLRGPLEWQSGSDLFNAIYMVGTSNKRPDAGGSFGFGKSAIFGSGELRVAYAYSCFAPGYEEPMEDGSESKPRTDGASRRAVGFLYWRSHKSGKIGFDGRAELAESPEIPFADARADEAADSWGVERRDPKDPKQHGTTFAIPFPRVAALDLVEAIEKFWWPAILDDSIGLEVEVVDADGTVHRPDPRSRADLSPFLVAFDVAQHGVHANPDPSAPIPSSADKAEAETLGPWRKETGARTGAISPGPLGVVLPSASQISEDFNSPIVARMRSTRMVIDYWRLDGRSKIPLPLRAVYIASSAEDTLLRKTEDAGHAGWAESGEPPKQPYELAAAVSRGIKEALREVCEIAKPKVESKSFEARMIGQLLALPGKGQGERKAKAPAVQVLDLKAERGPITSSQKYTINGSFSLRAVAEQSKQPETQVKVELVAKYSSEAIESDSLPYILSAPDFKTDPGENGARLVRMKRSASVKFEFSVPNLDGNQLYGVKIAPRITLIKTGEVANDLVD